MFEPFDHDELQAKRIAGRIGLHFHIDKWDHLTPHAGHKSETRLATDAELQMWRTMLPQAGDLDVAVADELRDTLVGLESPVYLNAKDVAVLGGLDEFKAATAVEMSRDGMMGTWKGRLEVYASREVPPGYVYDPPERDEQLHWRPDPERRETRPELDSSGFLMHHRPIMRH